MLSSSLFTDATVNHYNLIYNLIIANDSSLMLVMAGVFRTIPKEFVIWWRIEEKYPTLDE